MNGKLIINKIDVMFRFEDIEVKRRIKLLQAAIEMYQSGCMDWKLKGFRNDLSIVDISTSPVHYFKDVNLMDFVMVRFIKIS